MRRLTRCTRPPRSLTAVARSRRTVAPPIPPRFSAWSPMRPRRDRQTRKISRRRKSAVSPTIGRGGQSPETARSARRWKPIQDGRRGWTVWREPSAETEKTLMYGCFCAKIPYIRAFLRKHPMDPGRSSWKKHKKSVAGWEIPSGERFFGFTVLFSYSAAHTPYSRASGKRHTIRTSAPAGHPYALWIQ